MFVGRRSNVRYLGCIAYFRETAGQYDLYLDVEMDTYKLYGASVFRNEETGHYLYRSKFGDWTVGT